MRRFRGLIFDADGTLTRPVYDFQVLRKRLQECCEGRFLAGADVLHELEKLSPRTRAAAEQVIHDFEVRRRDNVMMMSAFFNKRNFSIRIGRRKRAFCLERRRA